ncbi:MAG: UDP-N-acetylmuramate dehydrogenase [Anaerolineales bacterium]|nr:UDP-N-acetylmuramate dehydrogenase [Anaerolineales bacterium]
MDVMAPALPLDALRAAFGERLREQQPLARYTSARLGGAADALVVAHSAGELAASVQTLWELDLPFIILGGGSNVLVSDAGVREVVLLNQAGKVVFNAGEQPGVWAESGAGLGVIARQAAAKGLGGLEWAAGIPGSLGGAVAGNAGAHGGDTAGVLELADILHRTQGRVQWGPEQLAYSYRTSWLKANPGQAVLLAARLRLEHKPEAEIRAAMDSFLAYRRLTQPPGASMGSMFKNPPGDSAGRLIEATGLKGLGRGEAQISPLHANFFLNKGGAQAADVYALIQQARQAVKDQSGVDLQLEVELIGDWNDAEQA